jgi:hypothetical protein
MTQKYPISTNGVPHIKTTAKKNNPNKQTSNG